jgi:hypothetical protein
MFKNDLREINLVKCIMCLAMKGKDVILGSKCNTLKKHARKTKVIWDMSHFGKKEEEFYLNKKCSHATNEITYFQHNHQCF